MKRFGRRVEIRYYLVVKRGNEEQLIAMAYQKVKKAMWKGWKSVLPRGEKRQWTVAEIWG